MFAKLAEADVDAFLVKAASVIRAQNAVIRKLQVQLEGRARFDHAQKIAQAAADRGILDVDAADDYARDLAQGTENLDMVESFVNRAAPGAPLGEPLRKIASEELGFEETSPEDRFFSSLLESDIA